MRRPTQSIVASPVLVGALTLLVACVGVLLAVSANKGLPFVPTYELSAEIPGGSNLVEGNDVRIGGFQIGLVSAIDPAVSETGDNRAVARISMKLDKKIEPLPADTQVLIRPRSVLGLKYVDLRPGEGRGRGTLTAGETIPLRNSQRPIELDEFFSTFDAEFRRNQRVALEGYGNAFSGRGENLNRTIAQAVPFFTHLEPVMRTLSDRRTRLGELMQAQRRFFGELAPVADTYADLFGNMGTTFEALSRSPESLRQTIERGAPTLKTGIRSFRVQRPFLRDTELLAEELEPTAAELERSLPTVSDALHTGTPVQRKAPAYYQRVGRVLGALRDVASNPNTLLALKDLTATFDILTPLITYAAPYQTVCNNWVYYWNGISEHVSEHVRGGTLQRSMGKTSNRTQSNRVDSSDAARPVDVPANQDPQTNKDPAGDPLQALHSQPYGPAVDAEGNADCQVGQRGYLNSLSTGNRYPPSSDPAQGGGTHVVTDSNQPLLSGPTFKGVPNLKDVP